MKVSFDSSIDWDAWYFVIPKWVASNWLAIVLTVLLATVGIVVFNKILAPYLIEYYKACFGYENMLRDMKMLLEEDYGSLWEDPEFCIGFLKLHEAFQTFLSVARSDHLGRQRAISTYNRFARIRLG